MTKIAILGDTHWGCRNDMNLFYSFFEKFYDDFIAYCIENNITRIFQLGDLFDRRKYINFKTLSESKRIFFDKLAQHNIELHVLVGNHDIFFRDTLDIVNFAELLKEYTNISIYSTPRTVVIDNTSIDMIPWICSSNEDDISTFISTSFSDICMGHFEIENFEMYRGMESHGGLPIPFFEKYERVFSGHFHTRSTKNNITYVGTPYEMTWQDYNDIKGFHIFDLNTRDLEFIKNEHTIFHKLYYDDTKDILNLDDLTLENCFVKVIVVNKGDLYKFDRFITKLETKKCFDIKIVEDFSETVDNEVSYDVDLEDTLSILNNYVESLDISHDKEDVKVFLKSLYIEAINSEHHIE